MEVSLAKKGIEKVKPPLAIVGTAESYDQTPWDDETVEKWCVATLLTKPDIGEVDRVFELHPRRYWGLPHVLEKYEELKVPIYMQDHYEEIPTSVKFPRDEIKEKFWHPSMGNNLFVTNTITWMILCALYEGYTDISLYGVHMAHDTEYGYQNASCSWALGMIQGWIVQGLPYKLYITEESSLLKARYEYGFDEPTKLMRKIQREMQQMKKGLDDANKKMADLNKKKEQTEGAITYANLLHDYLMGYK